MADFTELVDLAQERLGGAVVYANDEFFAPKENLLKASKPVWREGEYTDRGKWMDGWESRRRRVPGHDFCIVRLGVPGIVRGVVVDTAFFRGNFPPACSIDACVFEGHPDPETLAGADVAWTEILPKSALAGDSINTFAVAAPWRATHVRFHIYPDGGVARLRVHGDVLPSARWMGRSGAEVDLASVEHGGAVVAASDMFFGSRHNLVMPGRSVNMGDGWETKRSRREGFDWAVVRLAAEGVVSRIEIDTNHFKGKAPESASIDVCDGDDFERGTWVEILGRTKLQPHTRHFFEIASETKATFARLRIWPDGGVSRLRLFGVVTLDGRMRFGLRRLDALTSDEAERELLACCGSAAWAKATAARRPFASLASLTAAGDAAWRALGAADQLEAFRAHPRIGERHAAADTGATSRAWAEGEQAHVASAEQATRDALATENRAYEAKFGHVFLICATGKTGDEMLAALRARMGNERDAEVAIAAEEQRKIMHLRLEKMVTR
jgi:allantoicase